MRSHSTSTSQALLSEEEDSISRPGHVRWKSHVYPFALLVTPPSPDGPRSGPPPIPLPIVARTARVCPFVVRIGRLLISRRVLFALVACLVVIALCGANISDEAGEMLPVNRTVQQADANYYRIIQGWFVEHQPELSLATARPAGPFPPVATAERTPSADAELLSRSHLDEDAYDGYPRPVMDDGRPAALDGLSAHPEESPTLAALQLIVPRPDIPKAMRAPKNWSQKGKGDKRE